VITGMVLRGNPYRTLLFLLPYAFPRRRVGTRKFSGISHQGIIRRQKEITIQKWDIRWNRNSERRWNRRSHHPAGRTAVRCAGVPVCLSRISRTAI